MINYFGIIKRLFNRVRAYRRGHAMLNRLRAAHPGCRIYSAAFNKVSMGKSVAILDRVELDQVTLGDFSYVSNHSRLVNVTVGNFCSIGPYVQIGLGTHPSKIFVSTYPAFYSDKTTGCPLAFRKDKIFDDSVPPTVLGNDVWIGSNAIIPGGISIGSGAIVAAGSVVVKDVPPYAIVGGNPAQVIKYRFTEEQILLLLESEWWHWPIEKIRHQVNDFSDVERFIKCVAHAEDKMRSE